MTNGNWNKTNILQMHSFRMKWDCSGFEGRYMNDVWKQYFKWEFAYCLESCLRLPLHRKFLWAFTSALTSASKPCLKPIADVKSIAMFWPTFCLMRLVLTKKKFVFAVSRFKLSACFTEKKQQVQEKLTKIISQITKFSIQLFSYSFCSVLEKK